MPRIKLIYTNKKIAILITLVIIFFSVITIVIPIFLMRLIPQSGIGNYILEHLYWMYVFIPILLYFICTGIYYYKIKIDPYIIDIRSYRTILGIFESDNYIDISHAMLREFSFYNRPFSFNKTLMLKIETDTGKKVAKRFKLTLLSKKEEEKISKALNQITARDS